MPTETAPAPGQEQQSRIPRRSAFRDVAIATLIGLVALIVYNANLRSIPAADTYAARYLPFSILRDHKVVLDSIVREVAQGRKPPEAQGQVETAAWMLKGPRGHLVSLYPVAVPVVVAPLYLPAVHFLSARGWEPLLFDKVARVMEKLSASLMAAGSVMLFYLLLRRRCETRTAVLLTALYAFGTTTWVISSQALWMHGLAQLLVIATMLLLTGPVTALRAATAGFLCALIAVNRQPDAILAAGLGLYGLWWAGRRIPLYVAAGLVPVGLVVAYNLHFVGNIAGAYALIDPPDKYSDGVLTGIAGLLLSPTHGLFVFSPFLLFVPCFLRQVLRDRSMRGLTMATGCAMVVQVVLYSIIDWRQGMSFGPRWLTDMVPMLVWMLPPVLAALSRSGRVVFALAAVAAVAIEVVGAFWYLGVADAVVVAARGPDRMRPAWDVSNAPFIAELKHPPAPMDLLTQMRGYLDEIRVIEASATRGQATERRIEIVGWALADGKTPVDAVAMVDGNGMAGTAEFFDRPDVVRAIGSTSPAGWRISFPAGKLAPGDHVVSILVHPWQGGEPRLLMERTFNLAPPPTSKQRAVQALAERQQAPGYWLTDFTSGTAFERTHQELNTYLNAIMVDVLAPMANEAGMPDVLMRARRYLTDQIEPGGLVRYHGRPDAPTIGTLGCDITPDADDTALVWRVAPSSDKTLLAQALATLAQYRRADGLYRTWLAPTERYQCLDPGKDPNPADLGIQMHVFMLLAKEDPPAAKALCEAMTRKVADGDVWVYYADAPPLLILRLADLRKAGCALQLPLSRLRTTVPGQEIWVRAVQLLQLTEDGAATADTHLEAAELLDKIAANDFSLLMSTPPLFYHNDLTASVRRFYWSQELGYALWLRLDFENRSTQTKAGCRSDSPQQPCGEK
ncbi:hypothetical protein [Mesorhizobium sp. 131-2-1]|uniref:hypothetical protein n=1 Tax=Mesorhizobium sp. 131-2-1 TaxID=2744518 RepID=UPI0019255CBE|nr:hypothetical protein [Mesorhizobium sp. 131-2-1]BCG96663.1 hypothetical protein MesoLj131a_55270 [Mesorhizobium sp. 131-2-1]